MDSSSRAGWSQFITEVMLSTNKCQGDPDRDRGEQERTLRVDAADGEAGGTLAPTSRRCSARRLSSCDSSVPFESIALASRPLSVRSFSRSRFMRAASAAISPMPVTSPMRYASASRSSRKCSSTQV